MTPDNDDLVMAVVIFLLLLFLFVWMTAPPSNASITAKPNPRRDPVLAWTPPNPGRWYLSADNHAVWCAGPVIKVGEWDGLPHLYATRCSPGSMTVRLHE